MEGTFGYELDLNKMTEEEKVEVKRQIEVFKQYYDLISDGSYFRLTSPQDNNCVVWEMAAKDASKALISAVYSMCRPTARRSLFIREDCAAMLPMK